MISDVVKSTEEIGKLKELVIGTADLLSMLGRDVDIAWIYMGWQGIEAKLRGIELSTVMLRDVPGIPDYYTPIIITSRKFLESNKATAKTFITATSKGYTYAAGNPVRSANILIKHSPEINQRLATESQAWLSPRYIEDAAKWGTEAVDVEDPVRVDVRPRPGKKPARIPTSSSRTRCCHDKLRRRAGRPHAEG